MAKFYMSKILLSQLKKVKIIIKKKGWRCPMENKRILIENSHKRSEGYGVEKK
jgi:hypothetical protein